EKLRLILSDKEGHFVVLSESLFAEKASAAVEKNFKKVQAKSANVKKNALQLLSSLGLDAVAANVKKAKGMQLDMFFVAKTHKNDVPFRAIVSERHTWLEVVSRFLQGQLSALTINDPYRICNSQALVDFLRKDNPSCLSAASIDVEDLYYSLPHSELVESVQVCITQHNDELEFRSRCGLTVEAFLELLMMYLQSTVVGVGKDLYVQKAGVCIGSAVAPILSDIFLSRVDRKVSDSLAGIAEHIFRYVDDYLVLVPKDNYNQNVINVLKVFRENSCGLKFTLEFVQDKSLQFLDIKLLFKADHIFVASVMCARDCCQLSGPAKQAQGSWVSQPFAEHHLQKTHPSDKRYGKKSQKSTK
ncbi:uncharacterized protein LOC142775573, partial [Rhipicephalus microplus]|uniref:uncharacterized protein LOC142775573 n=1 Tax=Rhipicephalus microplus TaxID=6941 RepID=UPI003F6CB31D